MPIAKNNSNLISRFRKILGSDQVMLVAMSMLLAYILMGCTPMTGSGSTRLVTLQSVCDSWPNTRWASTDHPVSQQDARENNAARAGFLGRDC